MMSRIANSFRVEQTMVDIAEPDEVVVLVRYFSLGREECQAHGLNVLPSRLGAAFSGEVVKTSSTTSSKRFEIGDRVMGFKSDGGAMAEYVSCDPSLLVLVPPQLRLERAAFVAYSWVSAIQFLKYDASFSKRERLAVIGSNSTVGQTVVCLSQILGCRRVHCVEDLPNGTIPAQYYRQHGFLPDEVVVHQNVQTMTEIAKFDPKGLECVIDFRTTPGFQFEMLRPNGRMVLANCDIKETSSVKMPYLGLFMLKNIRLQGSSILSQKPTNFVPHLDFIAEHIIPKIISQKISQKMLPVLSWFQVQQFIESGNTSANVQVFERT